MPTLSQWKILNNLLRSRMLSEGNTSPGPQETEGQSDKENDDVDGTVCETQQSQISTDVIPSGQVESDEHHVCSTDIISSAQGEEYGKELANPNGAQANSDRPISERVCCDESQPTTKDVERESNPCDVNFQTSLRLKSAKRRLAADIATLPEDSELGDQNEADGTLAPNLVDVNQDATQNMSSDQAHDLSDLLNTECNSRNERNSDESLNTTDARCSSVYIPDLLDPNNLRLRRSSIQIVRSQRIKGRTDSVSRQPDAKANKSVKFSGCADVEQNEDEQSDSEDEDRLRISFEDVERKLSVNHSVKPRPKSCSLSDRRAKHSLESSMVVSSLQPLEVNGESSMQQPSNLVKIRRAVQLVHSNTSPHLFMKNRLDLKSTVESIAPRNQAQGEDNAMFPWRGRLKELGIPCNASDIRTSKNTKLAQDVVGVLLQRVGSARSKSPGSPGLLLRRNSSRFSLQDSDVIRNQTDDGNKHNLIIRGGLNINQISTLGKAPLNRTSSIRNGIHEISRWSMATQSIVTEQCASPLGGSRPSSGILHPKKPVVVSDADMPEDVQTNLQKLGFRKREKSKKKKSDKSKKSSQKKAAAKESKNLAMDLKQDPMLMKVQKKNRNVGKFSCPPELLPTAVCMEVTGTALSHADVLRLLKPLTDLFPEVHIQKIQFVYRSLMNNVPDMENRWIINTNSVASRNRLAGRELTVNGQVQQLRRYDDVIMSEYQQYMRMMEFVKMMNSRKIMG